MCTGTPRWTINYRIRRADGFNHALDDAVFSVDICIWCGNIVILQMKVLEASVSKTSPVMAGNFMVIPDTKNT